MASYIPADQYPVVKLALLKRIKQHLIAAYYGINQGRISEFKHSPMFDAVKPAALLPYGFPSN